MSRAILARQKEAAPVRNGRQAAASVGDLRIGQPDDAFEREANRVANAVMAGSATRRHWSLSRMSIGPSLQRKCDCGGSGECEDCKSETTLRRKAGRSVQSDEAPPIVHEVLSSPGRPLDHTSRRFFESRLGRDFSSVRIHTDNKAAASARAVRAQAYSVGTQIVFGEGQYRPDDEAGQHLIAHELAHRPSPAPQGGLNAPGRPLESETRTFFERRFQHDFGRVRVHADSESAASAKSLSALAYTVGSHVAFVHGQYKPATAKGRHLLAHELAHVAQQSDAETTEHRGAIPLAGAAQEREAEQISSHVVAGRMAPRPRSGAPLALARFSDTSHHVIEEAALPGAGFTPEQMRSIERGNVQRDYSQVGSLGNAFLLGQARGFGGYYPAEHFDNFIFDAVTNRWRTRGTGQQKFLHLDPNQPDPSPIDYIRGQLTELARAGMTEDTLLHLGNAFHTVEDFFAHSNFIELARKDRRFGSDLVTGSFEDNPANSAVSLAHTLGAVSTPTMQDFYEGRQAEAQTQLTEPRSHSRIAKDTPSAAGFTEARRLAALVIEDLGMDIVRVMRNPRADARQQMMEEIVMTKIVRYLRPPDAEHDPWWTQLISRGGATMDARLAEAERRTPVTVNQAPFSPLRNLEASRDSSMAIPLGVAVPVGRSSWFQMGAGVTRPSALDSPLPGPVEESAGAPFIGAQITGRF